MGKSRVVEPIVRKFPNRQKSTEVEFKFFPIKYEGEISNSITKMGELLIDSLGELSKYPALYIFGEMSENGPSSVYIGESNSVIKRISNHIAFKKLKPNSDLYIITGELFDASLTYNLETKLIGYFDNMKNLEAKFELNNLMLGQRPHEYGMKKNESIIFESIYSDLEKSGFIKLNREEIESSIAFKFSPFKILNSEQLDIMSGIKEANAKGLTLVTGLPGTGKSIIATAAMMEIYNMPSVKKIALVACTKQLMKAFIELVNSLSMSDKIDVFSGLSILNAREKYDYIIIDEGHRLKRAEGVQAVGNVNRMVRDTGEEDVLKHLLKISENMLVVYDGNQRVAHGDMILTDHFNSFKEANKYNLTEQMRAKGASKLLFNLYSLLDNKPIEKSAFEYDFRIFDDLKDMNHEMKEKSKKYKLVRYLAGYSFEWKSDKDPNYFDFKIDGLNLKWNDPKAKNWLTSKPAVNLEEVAYFDYIQGFDLDYAGLIIGDDLDVVDGKLVVVPKNIWGSNSLKVPKSRYKLKENDPQYLADFTEIVMNRYKILISRGTRGLFLYFTNPKVKEYFKKNILN